ncbi:MAG: glycosyltransferase [Candidatus Electrothrix sp. EH2]|nr:glycosyltransferase [Candidatus Electrothrix sp. EH2]
MKIFVTGTRGIPDIPGGVEKHCQELYPLIVLAGHEVILATRKPYIQQHNLKEWRGVQLCHVFTLRHKHFEAIIHTFLAIIKARLIRADIIHIHAVGPALMVPIARIIGLRVIFTHHGFDYQRSKWGKIAKVLLKLGEFLGSVFSNEVIVISDNIQKSVKERYGRNSFLIPNGAKRKKKSSRIDYLSQLGIKSGNYLLSVARFVPEKGLHDLINAFKELDDQNIQLVIAGDADHDSDYSRVFKKEAKRNKRIILTGYIGGDTLKQLFTHANLFVLPSYHEGLPLALLEAMSFNLPFLVSDIPAHRGMQVPEYRLFKCGDIKELLEKIKLLINKKNSDEERLYFNELLKERYSWEKIAKQTVNVYKKTMSYGSKN